MIVNIAVVNGTKWDYSIQDNGVVVKTKVGRGTVGLTLLELPRGYSLIISKNNDFILRHQMILFWKAPNELHWGIRQTLPGVVLESADRAGLNPAG